MAVLNGAQPPRDEDDLIVIVPRDGDMVRDGMARSPQREAPGVRVDGLNATTHAKVADAGMTVSNMQPIPCIL